MKAVVHIILWLSLISHQLIAVANESERQSPLLRDARGTFFKFYRPASVPKLKLSSSRRAPLETVVNDICSSAEKLNVLAYSKDTVSQLLEQSVTGDSGSCSFELRQSVINVGDTLRFFVNASTHADVHVERVSRTPSGNLSLSGTTKKAGSLVLVMTPDGDAQGSFSEGGDVYRIESRGEVLRFAMRDKNLRARGFQGDVLDADFERIPSKRVDERLPVDSTVQSGNRALKKYKNAARTNASYPVFNADSSIDVLIYYDTKMVNPELTIDYLFEYSNAAYKRSGIDLDLQLAGLIPVEISSADNNRTVLDLFKNREAPFQSADEDRTKFNADLPHIIRVDNSDEEEGNCGIASYTVVGGKAWRNLASGITEWKPATGGGGYYCGDRSFTHEIGHNLGAAHERGNSTIYGGGAHDYSFGYGIVGAFNTIMGQVADGGTTPVFSSPDLECQGQPCGVSPGQSNSADNTRTLNNTKFLVAAYGGESFDHAGIQFFPYDRAATSDGEERFTGVLYRNHTQTAVEFGSLFYQRADGSYYLVIDMNSVLQPGDGRIRGFYGDGDDQPIGSEIRGAFITYKHPETGEFFQATNIFFDDTYDGEYAVVRAAAGRNGSVVGDPSIHARVDAEVEVKFVPDVGYKQLSVSSTCPGSLYNNVYTAQPLYGDCWVTATFDADTSAITDGSLRKITEAYIGLLGRAPDLNGLNYWAGELDGLVASGANADVALKKLTNDITLSDEWRAGIGVNDGSTQAGAEAVVRAMYLNLFERSATPADVEYWSQELTLGRVTESQMVVLLIQGAQQKANADSGVLEYKRQAAAYYIEVVSSELFTRANAASVVDGVYDEQTLLDSKSMSDNLALGG